MFFFSFGFTDQPTANVSLPEQLGWMGQSREFTCSSRGLPRPSISWVKGGTTLFNSSVYSIVTINGSDGTDVNAFVAAGCAGIVSAGLAPGLAPPDQDEALQAAARAGLIVVQASRAGSGRVTQRANLTAKGFVAGDNLNPQKARVLLMLALTSTQDLAAIERIFATY